MGINVDSVVQTPFSTSVAGVGEKPDASPSITARPATPDRIALSDSGGGSPELAQAYNASSLVAYADSGMSQDSSPAFLSRTFGASMLLTSINRWLADRAGYPIMTATYDTGKPVGMVLERGKPVPIETTKAFFVLVRDDSPQGWHFQTSFPVK